MKLFQEDLSGLTKLEISSLHHKTSTKRLFYFVTLNNTNTEFYSITHTQTH